MDEAIRWGIIGTGTVARAFARGLQFADGAQIAAVASRRMENARAFAAVYGGTPYDSAEKLAADPKVQVVYIATPNVRHKDDCIVALDSGKAVLCEKPFAMNAAEAQQVVRKAIEKKLFCMEAMWMRFMPLVIEAKKMIADGALGEVQMLTADFALPVAEGRDMDGALLDRGVYCLSLAYYLLGKPDRISSTATMTAGGVDAQSSYTLSYHSGATAMMWSSLRTHGGNQAVVMGTKGKLRLHEPFYRPHRLTMDRVQSPPSVNVSSPSAPGLAQRAKESALVQRIFRRLQPLLRHPAMDLLRPIRGNGYNYEADEVMRCLRQKQLESPIMPLDETLQIMHMVDQIRAQWSR